MDKFSRTKSAVKDSRPLVTLVVMILLITFTSSLFSRVENTRWYRDMARLTPFHDVRIKRVTIKENRMSLVIEGSLRKRRCTRKDITVYTWRDGRPQVPGIFSNEEEAPQTPVSRPPTGLAQTFGPWTITSIVTEPDWASMWVTHECEARQPDGATILRYQYNEVFRLPWANYVDPEFIE